MRKLCFRVPIVLMGVLVLYACQKKESGYYPDTDNLKLEYILQMRGNAQRIAFNLLSNAEKVAIRKLHIHKILADKIMSNDKRSLINQLLAFNKEIYYSGKGDDVEYATMIFEKSWLEKAKQLFSPEDIYTIAYTLNTAQSDVENAGMEPDDFSGILIGRTLTDPSRSPYNNESLPDCNCSVGSSFTCPKTTITYDEGSNKWIVSVGYNPCTYVHATACDVEGGCGFMGWHICDGNKCS